MPDQWGSPEHESPPRVANGPKSSTFTVTSSTPMPVTTTLSVSSAPGRACCLLTRVRTCGVPAATVVSDASPQAVSAGRTNVVATRLSR